VICKKGELTPLVAAFAALPADDVRVPRCNDVIALMMETCVVGRTRGLHTLARDARSGSELHPPLPRRRSGERDSGGAATYAERWAHDTPRVGHALGADGRQGVTQEVVDVVLRGGVSSGSPDDADFSAALAQYRVPDRAVTACFTLQTRA